MNEEAAQTNLMLAQGAVRPASSAPDPAEDALVARAKDGDESAFTRLYDTHHDRVYRYILYRVRRVEDSEDLTQRAFLQAWQGLKRYQRTGAPFVAWLITIAHNVTMSFFRSHKSSEHLRYDSLDQDEASVPGEAQQFREDQEHIREAILQLNSDQQQVITMRFLEDFDYAQIAAALGKSEGNVRVIQHRALQQLRRILEGQ